MTTSQPPRRILLVSPLPPAMGGISVSTQRLRDNLVADGWEVDTYNLQKPARGIPHSLWMLLSTFWVPFYVLTHRRFDIIHLHVSGYWRRVFMWLARPLLGRARIVSTIHGDATYYTRRPLASLVFRSAHSIICVRPGDVARMPQSVRKRCVEIPAFIMPADISGLELPQQVRDFMDSARTAGLPLVVVNGMAVVQGSHPDLYGFEDTATALEEAHRQGASFAALLIVNDLQLDGQRRRFVDALRQRLEAIPGVMLCTQTQFSLLPVFAGENVIYVRPTKTDGDSLSVREALALGARVIASDVAERPEGTITYQHSLGAAALTEALVSALNTPQKGLVKGKRARGDFYTQIRALYESLLK